MLLALALLPCAWADQVVAVIDFDAHSVRPELQPLGLGLSDMLVTDLQRAPSLRLVERRKLREVLAEFDLAAQGYLDPAQAAVLGEGLGADLVVTGSITVAMEGMRLDARVIDVETGDVREAVSASGPEDQFFALEQQLATRLLQQLGAEVEVPVRDLTLDQAIVASQALGEADTQYLGRLDGVRKYKLQRLERGEYKYTTGVGGQTTTGTMWTVYDGGGQWIGPPEFAGRVGMPDLKRKLEKRSRNGKRVYWASIIGGSAIALGSTAFAGSDDGAIYLGTGLTVGLGTILVGAWTGYGMHARTTRYTTYWTAEEVDALVDQANRATATELGLTERDRLSADVSKE